MSDFCARSRPSGETIVANVEGLTPDEVDEVVTEFREESGFAWI